MSYNIKMLCNRNLKKHLRFRLEAWRDEQYRKANHSCFVTGKTTKNNKKRVKLDIHHLNLGFTETINKAHRNLRMKQKKSITKYTKEELDLLADEVIRIHYEEVEAICLEHKVHMYLHQVYGPRFTMEQLKSYKKYYRTRVYKGLNAQYNRIKNK